MRSRPAKSSVTQLAFDLTLAPTPPPDPDPPSPRAQLTEADHRAIAHYVVDLLRDERMHRPARSTAEPPEGALYVKAEQLMDRYQVSMKFIRSHATELGATRLSESTNSKLRYHLPTADAFISSHRKRQSAPTQRGRAGTRAAQTPNGAPLVPFT